MFFKLTMASVMVPSKVQISVIDTLMYRQQHQCDVSNQPLNWFTLLTVTV